MNKILIIAFVCLCQPIYSQVRDTIKDLPAEQVEVIKQFEARLEDARKINTIPEPPAQRVLEQFNYAVSIKPLELEYPEPSIRPLGMPKEELPKKYNGFITASAGNLNTLNAALGYHYMTENETEFDLQADYLTQENKLERFQKYSHLNTDLLIRHHFNELVSFQVQGGYHQRNVNFYGSPFDESTIADTSIYSRAITDYGFGFKFFNASENEYGVDYQLGLDYKNLSLRNENAVENNFLIKLGVNKSIGNRFDLKLDGIADISSILDTATIAYNNYHIKPGMAYHTEAFGIFAGLDFAFGPEGRNYFLPDVELSFSPLDYGLIPYLFLKAELQKNNLVPLIAYNPFLSTEIISNLRNSIVTRYGIGARGKLKGFHYDVNVAYGSTDDLVMFRNHLDDQGLRQFLIEQDSFNILDVNVGLEYKLSDQLEVLTHFQYIYYDEIVWQLPSYHFDLSARYHLLNNKLTISPAIFIRDGITVISDDREVVELPYMLDANIRASYQVANQFSVFGEVNNLLASEYQQWYDYSNFGLNAKAGINVKF
ncbi:TonB-dependent receptor [Portibacter marinus]|uniref:TonB-dependent receptor n=1 Tax=Portibacter marinus TaxID=2898660 RepID=UPI001F2A6C12|nr:TonB-dependent receptor [Portibacter marinus]